MDLNFSNEEIVNWFSKNLPKYPKIKLDEFLNSRLNPNLEYKDVESNKQIATIVNYTKKNPQENSYYLKLLWLLSHLLVNNDIRKVSSLLSIKGIYDSDVYKILNIIYKDKLNEQNNTHILNNLWAEYLS